MQELDRYIVLTRSMDRTVESEPNHKDPPVHDEPDLVGGSAVPPPALYLLKPGENIKNKRTYDENIPPPKKNILYTFLFKVSNILLLSPFQQAKK